jgi:hypothetical protein
MGAAARNHAEVVILLSRAGANDEHATIHGTGARTLLSRWHGNAGAGAQVSTASNHSAAVRAYQQELQDADLSAGLAASVSVVAYGCACGRVVTDTQHVRCARAPRVAMMSVSAQGIDDGPSHAAEDRSGSSQLATGQSPSPSSASATEDSTGWEAAGKQVVDEALEEQKRREEAARVQHLLERSKAPLTFGSSATFTTAEAAGGTTPQLASPPAGYAGEQLADRARRIDKMRADLFESLSMEPGPVGTVRGPQQQGPSVDAEKQEQLAALRTFVPT